MAIAWQEPFDLYPGISTAQVGFGSTWNIGGSGAGNLSLVTGLLSGTGLALALNTTSAGEVNALRPIPATKQISLAYYMVTELPDGVASPLLIAFATAIGVTQCGLRLTPTGFWQIIGENAAVMGTATEAITAGVVNHYSIRLDITTPGNNSFEMYINGNDVPALSVTGVDLQDDADLFVSGLQLYTWRANTYSGTVIWTIDHMICLYDEYVVIPELELYYIGPNSDDSVQFTKLSGASNFGMVDDVTIDSDTTYNYSNTPGDKDKFGLADPTFVSDYVWCVSSVTTARKEESSTQTIKNIIDKGGTEYASANIFLSTGYTINYTHNQIDPATGVAWNPADIAGLKSGYSLTTGL